MTYFAYGDTEITYLKKKDRKLGEAIDRIGYIQREVKPDTFLAVIDCIISQQISSKAADTVLERLQSLLGRITPENIAMAEETTIQKCGMSMRKVSYIKGIGRAVLDGTLDLDALRNLPDEEAIKHLVKMPGIGVWSAEMLLLFSFCRPDVVSYGDLAIRRGMMNLYGLEELTKDRFLYYRKRYSPYGSVASLYLWRLSVSDLNKAGGI